MIIKWFKNLKITRENILCFVCTLYFFDNVMPLFFGYIANRFGVRNIGDVVFYVVLSTGVLGCVSWNNWSIKRQTLLAFISCTFFGGLALCYTWMLFPMNFAADQMQFSIFKLCVYHLPCVLVFVSVSDIEKLLHFLRIGARVLSPVVGLGFYLTYVRGGGIYET